MSNHHQTTGLTIFGTEWTGGLVSVICGHNPTNSECQHSVAERSLTYRQASVCLSPPSAIGSGWHRKNEKLFAPNYALIGWIWGLPEQQVCRIWVYFCFSVYVYIYLLFNQSNSLSATYREFEGITFFLWRFFFSPTRVHFTILRSISISYKPLPASFCAAINVKNRGHGVHFQFQA